MFVNKVVASINKPYEYGVPTIDLEVLSYLHPLLPASFINDGLITGLKQRLNLLEHHTLKNKTLITLKLFTQNIPSTELNWFTTELIQLVERNQSRSIRQNAADPQNIFC